MFIPKNIHSYTIIIKKKLQKITISDELNKLNVEVLSSRNMIHEGLHTARHYTPARESQKKGIFHSERRSFLTLFQLWATVWTDGWAKSYRSVRNCFIFPAVCPAWRSSCLKNLCKCAKADSSRFTH